MDGYSLFVWMKRLCLVSGRVTNSEFDYYLRPDICPDINYLAVIPYADVVKYPVTWPGIAA